MQGWLGVMVICYVNGSIEEMGMEVVWKEGQKIKRTGEKRREYVKGGEKYDNNNNNNNHTNDNNNYGNNSNNNNNDNNYNSKWNNWIKK